MKIRILIYISLLFSVLSLKASPLEYNFRTFSPKGGFYYDGVKAITQDGNGFIWIMMDYDLFRFDGYEYKRYYSHFQEWEQARNWSFNGMVVDQNNNFYIATNDGLYRYSQRNDSFEQLIAAPFEAVRMDAKNNIWVQAQGKAGIVDVETREVAFPQFGDIIPNYFRAILPTDTQELYLITNLGKIFRYDYVQKEIVPCHTQKTEIMEIGYVEDAIIDKGKLWVGIKNRGLFKMDLSTFKVEERYKDFLGEQNTMRKLLVDKDGSLWVGTMNGLHVMDKQTKKFRHFQHVQDDETTLPNNSVWTIFEDWHKNLWIGTYSGGLCYVNTSQSTPFKTYTSKVNQLNYTPVSSFAENADYLWIGTEGGGLNRLNKHTEKFDYFVHDESRNSLIYNNVKSIILDNNENLWIGTYTGGIDCYNTKTGHFTNYKTDPKNRDNTLLANSIRKIVEDGDRGFWIAYQAFNLTISYFSYKDKSVKHFKLHETDNRHYIFDMLRDRSNNLWVLTHQKLVRMNIDTEEIEDVVLSDSLVISGQSFGMDASGNLWIGTVGKGLIEYNTSSKDYTIHKEILQHNASSIYGICYDSDGMLWLGTNNGLFKYNIATKEYARYEEYDGTQGNMYYPLSVYKGLNETIYFGGTNGFTAIEKDKISANAYHSNVFLTDFMLDNVSVASVDLLMNEKQQVVLDYDQTNFGFRFSSDNYLMPEKNKFMYRLVGYDENWILVDSSTRAATYSKVPAGKYTFEVLAANNDGLWNDKPLQIDVLRKPAPWLSLPAYFIYALSILGILYAIYYYYRSKKDLQLQLYLEGVEQNKRDEIHESQLRFFTNISHDFRTPLSLIIGVVEKLRHEGLKEYYFRILNGNSQRLLNLVNELMDFRAVENGKMSLEVERASVNGFVTEIADSFSDYAVQHKIDFEIKTDAKLPQNLHIDKYVMEKVLMNLLNNAFKYTEKKGSISIETYALHTDFKSQYVNSFTVKSDKEFGKYFSIVIRDTGVGISKESIESVFDRYYKVKTVNLDSHLGTGIGLALVKSLTILHKGFITIYSERDKGTDIEVCFPLDGSCYSSDEFKTIEDKKEPTVKATNNKATAKKEVDSDTYDLPDEETEGMVKSNKYRLLLAEDNDDLRGLIRDALAEDFEVIEAENGDVASKLLDNNEVDIIVSDIMMPVKDGVAFCEEVKNNLETSHIPFVMLSAKTSVESKIEGVDSGADIYFEKPIDFELLRVSLNNIFKQRELLREHYAKNYFAESSELSMNEKDNEFLKDFIGVIEKNIDKSDLEVNYIASQLSMSRSKLYNKVKGITGKSIVEFILNYRLRKAARLIIEEDLTMREVMVHIGIESQPYFTNAFKKEFGKTPTQFASENKNKG